MKLLSIMACFVAAAALAVSGTAAAAPECGSLQNPYGPFDYRTGKEHLKIVEAYHFTPEVEALKSGHSSTLGGDLDYTLRASPNHHRALNSMMNLALRTHMSKPRGASYTIDCYFDRAIRFAPDDGEVQSLYGVYLARIGHKQDAVKAFQNALKTEERNPNVHYNLGLVYFDLKDYPNALEQAHEAYRLGAALPGLRNKLKEAGKWRDDASPAGPAARESASAPPKGAE
jgi:Flp pilus assembly protein TadD